MDGLSVTNYFALVATPGLDAAIRPLAPLKTCCLIVDPPTPTLVLSEEFLSWHTWK